MKNLLQLLILSSLALLFGSSVAQTKSSPKLSPKFPLTLEHKLGNTILPKQPVRIVALGEEITDLLFALETFPNAVGSSRVASGVALNTVIPKADFYNRSFYRAALFMESAEQPSLEADRVIALRFPAQNGKFEPLSAETLLEKRGLPLLRYGLNSSEPSNGPTTDLKRLEEFARLLEGSK